MMMVEQEPIHSVVERVWRQEIGFPTSWSVAQIDQHLAAEADRIETLIDRAVPGQGPLVSAYHRDHGRAPDYLTTVTLINRARAQAREQILTAELYDKIPTPAPLDNQAELVAIEQERQDQALRAVHREEPDRWTTALWRSEPAPEIVELTKRLWKGQHVQFRVLAQYLLQARQEDGQPIPQTPTSPLLAEFSNLVDQALRDKGLPHAQFRSTKHPS